MKILAIIGIITGVLGGRLAAQTADQDVASGLSYLAAQDVVHANQQFTNALVLSPTNASANALVAVTRLLLLPTVPAGSNFLNSLGFSKGGRDIFNWTSSLPVNVSGDTQLPSQNTAVMVAFYRTNIMAALAASRTNLAAITDPGFTLSLTAGETSLQDVTVDYGDILLLQALERTAEFAGYTANAWNGDVVLTELQSLHKANQLTIQKVLATYPSLLALSSTADLAGSKGALTNAIGLYFAASDFIRNVRAPGAPALFTLSDDETNDEALFRTELTNALLSLNGPAQFNAPDPVTINASNYFTGAKTLRSLVPQFSGDFYVPGSLPDYTFGGLLVNEPAYLVEEQVRHMFYSYAGIYVGEGDLWDNNYNTNNSYGYGSFAVIVNTNQQATLVGTDNGDGSSDTNAFGVIAQFNVDNGGSWSFQSNNVSGFGSLDKGGNFNGELDYDNGINVSLYAFELTPPSPLQNAAGYYSGTIQGGVAENLNAVLASDGEISFCPSLADGTPVNGGYAQFDANNQFITTNVSGTVIAGSLNPHTFVISGTFTSTSDGQTGTWTLTRAATVPFGASLTYPDAGIYFGQLNDNNDAITNIYGGSGGSGRFAVFVNSQQATIIGTDNGDGSDDGNDFGVIAQVNVDSSGNWTFQGNNVSGSGTFNNYGGFYGELDYDDGTSVYLNAWIVNSPGPLQNQNAAGYYSGTIQGGKATKLNAILAADGEFSFCPILANGTPDIGGYAQLNASNQFITTTVSGTVYAGTLNPNTFVINGTFTNISNSHGTWTLSRSAKVPSDASPVITKDLPMTLTAQVGTNLTLSLTASGSPPLSFQWYSNSVPLPWSTTNVLVINHLSYSAAGDYSVTIDNVAGEADSAVLNLVVVPELIPPTNQITLPTSGMQVSNALYTVTGKAGDNVAVSNVMVQLNNGGWTAATTTNQWANWTAQVSLTPGSNTVQAYAVDTSANISKTNTVLFKYVVSAPLTVQLVGRGTISPNDSNALLQVGASYSLKAAAVAGSGFAFTNWTGGTNLPLAWLTNGTTVMFTMASNLILQANFLDTNRPALVWTNVANVSGNLLVTGTNNETVAQVFGRLNGAAWTTGSVDTNGRTWSWETSMTNLIAGTNQFQYYALGFLGNYSLTNSPELTYIINTPLIVRTNGLGTLTPNYNGASLQLGENYSITATPATGFVFTNWTGGTNYPLSIVTNRATVRFLMATNLILQANFVETNRPTLVIVSPTAGKHLTNALAYVTGTAVDTWKVTGVWCQLNSNSWATATSTNGWTNWTKMFQLLAGTNTIRAYAANLGGYYSTTNSVSVLSSNAFKLWFSLTNAQAAGGMGFNLQLSAGLNGNIEVSTNLADWTTLTNFTGTNASVNFRDPAATNGARFYRAVVP